MKLVQKGRPILAIVEQLNVDVPSLIQSAMNRGNGFG